MQSLIPDAKSNNGEEGPEDLAKILRKHISNSLRDFRTMRKAKATTAERSANIPEAEPWRHGKATTMVVEETINFSLPQNFDVSRFKDLDKVLPMLKHWRIESRQRNTTMRENKSGQRGTLLCDTYYHHPSCKRTLRSIPEVVNYILPESYDKLPKRKRFKNEKVTSTCNDIQNTEEETNSAEVGNNSVEETNNAEVGNNSVEEINNAEVGNNSVEKSQSLSIEEGFTLHDVGTLPFEELQEIIESLGADDNSKIYFM